MGPLCGCFCAPKSNVLASISSKLTKADTIPSPENLNVSLDCKIITLFFLLSLSLFTCIVGICYCYNQSYSTLKENQEGKNSTIFYAAVAAWLLPLTYLLTKKGRLCTDFETDKIGAGLIYHEKHLLKAAAVFSRQTQT